MTARSEIIKKTAAKPYHHGDLRQEILVAARQLMEENSITSLSLREVAKKVGVSHTAPYRHFKDKESLLAGIAAIGFDELAAEISKAAALYPDNPAQQLLEAGHCYMKLVISNPQCIQLMFGNVLPCDDTYPNLRKSGDFAFDSLKIIIQEGQAQGVFKAVDVELMALTAWSSIHGLSMLFAGEHVEAVVSLPAEMQNLTTAVMTTMLEGLRV